ncbi:ATPase [Maribellus comscasis]|uniref:ATPase n=1 Tax=Maribellus comscasis TaxID=2681766 RepID=A0A6I6K5J8_9BACT|nr:NifB/NifX family molybdenum-iron cluster-binding protein [Maribellus comscasis]QGY46893.1 ATPase [Maribellus comscasis]
MNKKIAVPVDNHMILDGHFGHCKFFAVFEIRENTILSEEKIVPPPHEPGLLPKWLAEKGVSDVLAGGMGNRAIQIFNHHKVNVFVGAPKMDAKQLAEGFLNDSIQFTANYCDH